MANRTSFLGRSRTINENESLENRPQLVGQETRLNFNTLGRMFSRRPSRNNSRLEDMIIFSLPII